MSERVGSIYVLIEPLTHEIRYVGKTVKPVSRRLYEHCWRIPSREDQRSYYSGRWIDKLLRQGLKPSIDVVQRLPESHLDGAEIYWIKYFRDLGCRLTNTHDGGNGGWSHMKGKPSAFKGKTVSPEARALISAKNRGRVLSAETRARMSAAKQRDREKIRESVVAAWDAGKFGPRRVKSGPHPCGVCDRTFPTLKGASVHRSKIHPVRSAKL